MKKSIFLKIFSANALLLIILSVLVLFSSFEVIRQQFVSALVRSLRGAAEVSLYAIKPRIKRREFKKLQRLVKDIAEKTESRITVVLPNGKVYADSEEDARSMENHKERPEIKDILEGKEKSRSIRFSRTLNQDMLYVAIPVKDKQNVIGVLRISIFLKDVSYLISKLKLNMIRMTFLFMILVLLGAYIFAKSISDPIKELSFFADKVGSGDFDSKIELRTHDELKQLGSSFNNMTEKIGTLFKELKHMEQVRKDFVTNVSHEMRTPLTAIKGFAETLKDSVKGEEARYVDIIEKHSDRLINIVNDLLVLSNLESSKYKIEFADIMIDKVLDDVIKLFDDKIRKKNLKIEFKKNAPVKLIKADPFRLEQVFINIIDNAIKYTEKGGIYVEINQDKQDTTITIKDTGIGIKKEHLNRIFERFYVVDKSRSKNLGGTGLGLSIVKHIVNLHKGSIEVKSISSTASAKDDRENAGTTFKISIPSI